MKRHIITTILIFVVMSVCGQNYGERIDPNKGFSEKLKSASEKTETISCDFNQTKYMSVLTKPVTSKGRFYYKREQNICLEYSAPQGNAVVMSSGRFKMVNAGNTTVIDNKANPMMRQLSEMLTACMTGNIELFGADATTDFYESAMLYTVVITPTNRRVKAYIKQIVLSFDKQDMTLSMMRMNENGSDYTVYEFKAKKINVPVSEAKFKI